MVDEPTSEKQTNLEKQQKELEELAKKQTEHSQRIIDKIGELMEIEKIETCVFIGVSSELQMPVVFYRGEINKATRLAGLARQMLVKQIQDEINP